MPSLLVRLRDQEDEWAWQTFFDAYSPLIYNFCRLKRLQSDDAADVTQEVLLRVARAIGSFEYDRTKGLFRDWLARIVQNEICRQVAKSRKAGKQGHGFEESFDVSSDSTWQENYHQHLFDIALERCKLSSQPETWEMFERSWVRQEPAAEVAQVLGVSIDRVYVARCRILKRLRREIAILADDIV
ncbi:MAG: sigma-70 family RNA polymerase sigma factor [Pirellulaceae bacterium]